MRTAISLIVLFSLAVFGCSEDTPLDATTSYSRSDTPDLARGAATRPFRGHWQTTFDNLNSSQGTIEIHGVGFGTHLGASSFDTVQPLAPFVPFDATLIAANGDELHYVAIGDPVQNPSEEPFSFSGTLEFVGGTGRFMNSTGNATFEGTASLTTMTGEVTYTGTITF